MVLMIFNKHISNNINLYGFSSDQIVDKNYDKISFDLWEEKKGWHFYTRMVQLKFLKDIISINKYLKLIYNSHV